jgi:uncharacterized protein (DUF924 family)
MSEKQVKAIFSFWFSKNSSKYWFSKSDQFDADITKNFADLYEDAVCGQLDKWKEKPRSALALVILLDQFPRNMFRNSAKAFFTDGKALSIAKYAVEKGYDKKLSDDEKKFLYLPFMHSESLVDQKTSLQLFRELGQYNSYDYAIRHHDIIAEFGRYPHRNKVLKRKSTAKEVKFLKKPDSSF